MCVFVMSMRNHNIKQPFQNIGISCACSIFCVLYAAYSLLHNSFLAYINTPIRTHTYTASEICMNVSCCVLHIFIHFAQFEVMSNFFVSSFLPCFECHFFGISFGNSGNRDSFIAKKNTLPFNLQLIKLISTQQISVFVLALTMRLNIINTNG